jgi:hypothetical protein
MKRFIEFTAGFLFLPIFVSVIGGIIYSCVSYPVPTIAVIFVAMCVGVDLVTISGGQL